MPLMPIDSSSSFPARKAGVGNLLRYMEMALCFSFGMGAGALRADVSMNFPDGIELPALIQAVSAWKKDRTILFTPQEVKGKITIISPDKVSEEDGYAAFLASLQQLGYSAMEAGDAVRIEKIDKSRKSTTKVFQGEYPITEDVITYLYPLKNADGEELKRVLANFTNSGTIQVSQKTNLLILSNTGMYIDHVMRIIEVLDVDRQKMRVEIYPVSRLSAEAMVSHLLGIFKKSPEDKNYGDCTFLADSRTNSVMIAAPVQKIESLLTVIKEIDSYTREGEKTSSLHLVPLRFAEAKSVAALLESAKLMEKKDTNMGGAKQEAIRVVADEPSNSLFVLADADTFQTFLAVVRKLDQKKRQYGIELHIFSVTKSSTMNFGTSLLAGAAGNKTKGLIGWEAAQTAPLVLASSDSGSTSASKSQQAQLTASTFDEGVTFSYLSGTQVEIPGLGNFTPQALLKTLKTDSDTKVLSEPFLLTQDQQEATFSVGQRLFFNIPIQAGLGTTQTQPNIDRQDIGLTLRITPHGDAQGIYTQLEVEVEDTTVAGIQPNGYPELGKRKAKQILQARNGQMILMSGLRRSIISKTEKKIPGLSDIPVVSIFARSTQDLQTEENLMLFMKATPMDETTGYSSQYEEPLEKLKKASGITRSQS